MLAPKFKSCEFLDNINIYEKRKYITVENAFTRNRKLTHKDIMLYPLLQCGRTNEIESIHYIQKIKGDENITITGKAIAKQRMKLDPLLYEDMANDHIQGIYQDCDEYLEKTKGYIIAAIDGSIISLPTDPKTKKEFIKNKSKIAIRDTSRARASCIYDTNNEFILNSKIECRDVSEYELAKHHLNSIKNTINMEKLITIYDRGYNNFELMLDTIKLKSKFLIRLKSTTLKQERKTMKTNDELVNIRLNNKKYKYIKNEELKQEIKGLYEIKLRITNVTLKTGETETLISNIPFEEFNTEEIKELYHKRWRIENNYDDLKNKIELENFTGKRKEIIKQDFYSSIFILNLMNSFKLNAEDQIRKKQKNKNIKLEYKVNKNYLIGLIKKELLKLLDATPEEKKERIKFIEELSTKNLVTTNKDQKTPKRKQNKNTNRHNINQRRAY